LTPCRFRPVSGHGASVAKKAQGPAYRGYNASKQWHYWGWQLHLVCDIHGVPVHFEVLPAAWDELTATPHLLADLPPGSQVLADEGYVSLPEAVALYEHGQVQLIAKQQKNMTPISTLLGDKCPSNHPF
jgi:hypothetical protein